MTDTTKITTDAAAYLLLRYKLNTVPKGWYDLTYKEFEAVSGWAMEARDAMEARKASEEAATQVLIQQEARNEEAQELAANSWVLWHAARKAREAEARRARDAMQARKASDEAATQAFLQREARDEAATQVLIQQARVEGYA